MLKFYHPNDPSAPRDSLGHTHHWPFVYLHGRTLENRNTLIGNAHQWAASDLFAASEPMPDKDGDYEATFYGIEVVAVIRQWHTERPWLSGRVAEVIYDENYEEGLTAWEHAHQPEQWR